MIINHNISALNTYRQLSMNTVNGSKSLEKLSSGLRINRAGDDAAGLAISEKMRGQIRGLNQASRNAQDSISLIQTSEGALTETHSILQRMRELAVQSANDTNVDVDRSEIQKEINQLAEEITRIAKTTEFNTQKLLDGTLDNIKFQIGANQDQNMQLSINDMSAEALKVISDTVSIGSKGAGITGVQADLGFDLTGAELTAAKGGAVGAKAAADASAIGDGFAKDITGISTADGITVTDGSGAAPTLYNGTTANQVSISESDDIDWKNIDLESTATITIGKNDDDELTVAIDVTDSNGDVNIDDALADVDADGNYTYDAHGIKFTISAEDFANMENDTKVEIDLADIFATGDILNGGSSNTIGTKNSWTTNTLASGGTKAAFKDNEIKIDYSKLPDGITSIKVAGDVTDITVTLYKGLDDVLSTDSYKLDSDGKLIYDNHGVSFEFDVNDATAFEITQNIETFSTKVTNSDGTALKFDITDDNGNLVTGIEVTLGAGDYSLEQVRDAINAAVTAKGSGTFAGNVADIVDGNLVISSAYKGADSVVDIKSAGGFASLFATGKKSGAADSIELTLKDSAGSTIGTKQTIAPNEKSVSFKDTNGNMATFSLKGYDNLNNVDVSKEFAASSFKREVTGIDVSSHEAANKAVTVINSAIESVSAERSKLGAVQNRLEHTINNLDTSAENLQASESRIRDVDMAKEMMEFYKNSILQQAAQAMLAQANQQPQGVLQLLR
jgi:flagellin